MPDEKGAWCGRLILTGASIQTTCSLLFSFSRLLQHVFADGIIRSIGSCHAHLQSDIYPLLVSWGVALFSFVLAFLREVSDAIQYWIVVFESLNVMGEVLCSQQWRGSPRGAMTKLRY